jgi:phosphoglycerol transferase MdoB-like AlkP superfamily enzyme
MNLSFKNYYWRWLKNLFLLFILSLCTLSLARVGFGFYYGDVQTLLAEGNILLKALLLGVRYDLMPLAYINALPFLLIHIGYFIPGKQSVNFLKQTIRSLLVLGYFLLTWIYVCDYGFYSYFQDHLNILFFGFFEDDTLAVVTSIWKNYNVPLWLGVLAVFHIALFKLVKIFFSSYEMDLKVKNFDYKFPVTFVVGVISLAFMARGSFTRLPLSLEDAHISSHEFINKLSLNGVLTLNRALKIRKTFGEAQFDYLKKFSYASWEDAFQDALHSSPMQKNLRKSLIKKSPLNLSAKSSPPHVVVVVMESFGSYWNEKNGPDFNILGELQSHFEEDFLFKNFLPAENGTIGSIVSVSTSQVIRPGARFLSESEFMTTSLGSSGHLPYKNAGFDTHFVYGGKLGWRDLGKFLAVQKYDKLWGADEIKEAMPELKQVRPRDLGNEWGIFDEYLYAFIEEQLKTATRPQFFLVLSTSNHPPFEFPTTYNTLPLTLEEALLNKLTVDEELARKRFSGFQYANQKMGEFLTRIKRSHLKDNAVVALTGDHSFWISKGVGLEEEFKRYAVPFYIYAPERLAPATYDKEKFGSHEDIFPTLYQLTLSEQNYVGLGENLFSEASYAMNSSGLVANKSGAYHHGEFWRWKNRESLILERTEESPELLKLKKHYSGLIGITDLYLKEEKNGKQIVSDNDRPE